MTTFREGKGWGLKPHKPPSEMSARWFSSLRNVTDSPFLLALAGTVIRAVYHTRHPMRVSKVPYKMSGGSSSTSTTVLKKKKRAEFGRRETDTRAPEDEKLHRGYVPPITREQTPRRAGDDDAHVTIERGSPPKKNENRRIGEGRETRYPAFDFLSYVRMQPVLDSPGFDRSCCPFYGSGRTRQHRRKRPSEGIS